MAEIKIVNELGPGKCFTDQGELYTVMDIQHNKTAMRQMIVKIKVKNLRSGVVKDLSFTGGDKVQMVYLDKRKMGYLYDDGTFCVFMDNETYDQVSIPKERLKWGYGRIVGHEDLYVIVSGLLQKEKTGDMDCNPEISLLEEAVMRQTDLYREEIRKMKENVKEIKKLLEKAALM